MNPNQQLYSDTKGQVSLRYFHINANDHSEEIFTDETLHIIYNLHGNLTIVGGNIRLNLIPYTMAVFYVKNISELMVSAKPTEQEFILISLKPSWVSSTFRSRIGYLNSQLVDIIQQTHHESILLGNIKVLTSAEYDFCNTLISPDIHMKARDFWYHAKIIEILSWYLFRQNDQEELFCNQHKQRNKDKVRQTHHWLKSNLDQPLNLEKLSSFLSCSPSHISRVHSQLEGVTISQMLRQLRIEKAASYLSHEDYSVTEVALEVGYNSLSHFTKAFKEIMGKTPKQYMKQPLKQRDYKQ